MSQRKGYAVGKKVFSFVPTEKCHILHWISKNGNYFRYPYGMADFRSSTDGADLPADMAWECVTVRLHSRSGGLKPGSWGASQEQ